MTPIGNARESPNGTNVAAFVEAYHNDDNAFWYAQSGDIQNVLDEAISPIQEACSFTYWADFRPINDEAYILHDRLRHFLQQEDA